MTRINMAIKRKSLQKYFSVVVSLFLFLNARIKGIVSVKEAIQLIEMMIVFKRFVLSATERRITRYENTNSVADFPVVNLMSASKKAFIQI